jgi:hypothetical protein
MGPCSCNPDTTVVTANFKSRLKNIVGAEFSRLKWIEKNYGLLVWDFGGWGGGDPSVRKSSIQKQIGILLYIVTDFTVTTILVLQMDIVSRMNTQPKLPPNCLCVNVPDLSGAGDAPMSRRKSFKQSVRESVRRLRKGRSARHTDKRGTQNTTSPTAVTPGDSRKKDG